MEKLQLIIQRTVLRVKGRKFLVVSEMKNKNNIKLKNILKSKKSML